jgi:hypothetical protein
MTGAGEGREGGAWAERLLRIDRRIIFLGVLLAVVIPILKPIGMPVVPSRESIDFFRALEVLKPGDIVLFSFDYEPDTRAELDPMSLAVWRYLFRKNVRIIAVTMYAGGTGIAEAVMNPVAKEYGKVYGKDYVFLGYNPDWSGTMLRLGESFRATYPADQYGRSTAGIPLMQDADRYDDVPLLISIAASALAEYWAIWAGGKFGQKVIAGATAIQAVLLYPYYQTGQISGFLGGLKGAAELEKLTGLTGDATRGMDAQSTAHALMVVFILLGNAGYALTRWKQRR